MAAVKVVTLQPLFLYRPDEEIRKALFLSQALQRQTDRLLFQHFTFYRLFYPEHWHVDAVFRAHFPGKIKYSK